MTQADLQEQFEHNMRMRELVTGVNQLLTRIREGKNKVQIDLYGVLTALEAQLLTEPVRYGQPGLQAHITYLAGMTAAMPGSATTEDVMRLPRLPAATAGIRPPAA